jgi:hypothetical protein
VPFTRHLAAAFLSAASAIASTSSDTPESGTIPPLAAPAVKHALAVKAYPFDLADVRLLALQLLGIRYHRAIFLPLYMLQIKPKKL